MEKSAIKFENVSGGYQPGNNVIHNITAEISTSEFAALIGPNGSGKSTLLKTACGWLKKSGGSLKIFGEDIEKITPSTRPSFVGMVPQTVETPLPLTAREIVMLGRTRNISRWRGASEYDREVIKSAMKCTDTLALADNFFYELSGGEKQRVLIAMALAQEPQIILLDEATAHLDINHTIEVMQIIKSLNKEKHLTILMASHDINITSLFADRIFIMKDGKIVCSGSSEEVLTPKNIKDFYNCDVEIYKKNGCIYTLPLIQKQVSYMFGKQ
jgi:iron complex transport system ATP-binding protein